METCYKCSKCGQSITDNKGYGVVCPNSAPYRISGICGGSLIIPITKEEYDDQMKEWEYDYLRNKKND